MTRKGDHVDYYHGVAVPDPYRWLEDDTSAETAAWVEAQNNVTLPYLERIPFRAALHARVLQLNDYEKYSAPLRKGPYLFFTRNAGLQNQSVLFIQAGRAGAPEVLIDPNTWSADGTVSLSVFVPSKDATYAVYGISQSGSDWHVYKVMDLASRKTLDDTIEWVKVSGVAWCGDGFFYSRYPAPPAGQEKASINENHQVFFHRIGTPQSQDRLIYEDAANPQRFHTVQTTEDERFAILSISERGKGADGNALHVCDLSKSAIEAVVFTPLVATISDDSFVAVDNVGDRLLVQTNRNAPNWRVVLIDPARPDETSWIDVLPERSGPLQTATAAGGKLFATYLEDVATRVYVHGLDGSFENEVSLPGPGAAAGFDGSRDDTSVFYTFNSLSVPPTIYEYDIATGTSAIVPALGGPWLRSRAVRNDAGVLHEPRRHPRADVPGPPQGPDARRQQPDAALRLRRLQHRGRSDVQRRAARDSRTRGRLRIGEPARRRRIRRVLASAGHQAPEAERLRRLHCGRRVAHRQQLHVAGSTGDPGRIERRVARRRGHQSAAGAVSGRDCASRRDGHAALSQVHHRLELGRRLRIERRPGGVQDALRVLAASQHQDRRDLSGDARHDCRSR